METNNEKEAEKRTPEATVKRTDASDAENPHPDEDSITAKCTSVCSIEGQRLGQDQSLIVPVWVSSSENAQEDVLTYALIDYQSNATSSQIG